VFKAIETVNIPDAYADDRFNRSFDQQTGYRTRTILCMPVQNKAGVAMGVIQVLNKAGGPFTQRDERRLSAFCAQAAIAIENAQLFEEVVRIKNYNESILHSMTNGVITLDADNCVAKLNVAALSLLGLDSEDEQLGLPLEETLPREAADGTNVWLHDAVERVRSSGVSDVAPDVQLFLPARGESASANVTTLPLKGSGGESLGCMLVVEDLTTEKRLRNTMARYMTKEVADKLLEEGESALGGTSQHASILFSDIRGFTTMSERLGAQETVAMLNDYFSIMVDIILDNSGILDKYIGDAIMAVFGAPFPGPEDADNSLRAAILMMTSLGDFNIGRIADGKDPVLIGIGINSDDVMSGNIGSEKRMDYTVIGDGVNLAARLEGANKPYGTEILISGLTRKALADPSVYSLREVDLVTVKGKTEPVAVHESLDHRRVAAGVGGFAHLDDVLGLWPGALSAYRSQDFVGAVERFTAIERANPADKLTQIYLDRCREFLANSPGSDWDGVYTMKTK
jgi:adenylate cyclase